MKVSKVYQQERGRNQLKKQWGWGWEEEEFPLGEEFLMNGENRFFGRPKPGKVSKIR